jgi:ABC-type uncharacterized transport system permease subunit
MSTQPAATTYPPKPISSLRQRLSESVLPVLLALAIALLAGDLLILAFGQSPGLVFRLLIEGAWGNAWGIGQVLYKATTLTFTGLAVGFALRSGLFNIGAESQLAAGGFAAAGVGLMLPAGTPFFIAIPLCIVSAALGGALVGAVPGVLKARFGAHEVIVTIMMNFIVLALLNYIVAVHLHVPETLRTPSIQSGQVPRLAASVTAFHGSAANLTILVALFTAVAVWWILFRTRAGYNLRAVGLQPDAAEYGGIDVRRVWLLALVGSGAIAGLGGINYVLGYKGYYEDGLAGGAGYLGIAVALVGRNHPLGICLAALLFATLSQGGLAIHALVPKDLVDILQGLVIIAIAVSVEEVRRVLRAAGRL